MATIIMDGATQSVQLDNISVLKELEHTNPYRSEIELAHLKDQIRAEGLVRDPLIIWPSKEKGLVLVDGFSRLRICKELRIETGGFGTVKAYFMEFDSLQEVKFWITVNQSNRRNLTDEQKAYCIGNLALALESKSKVKEFLKATSQREDLNPEASGRDMLAKHFTISSTSVQRHSKYALGLNRIRERNETLADGILSNNRQGNQGQVTQKVVQFVGTLAEGDFKQSRWRDVEGLMKFYKDHNTSSSPSEQSVIPVKKLKDLFNQALKAPTDENFDLMIKALIQARASLDSGKMKVA